MKNLFAKLPKKLLVLLAFVAIALGVGAASTYANPGPDRPTRPWTVAENGFDYVTFNSFTGVPNGIGDERDFLRATINGSGQTWTDPVGPVQNNEKITAKIYIHNNADSLLNTAPGAPGIARDVNVKIEIPTGLQTEHEVKSYISASNAQPQTIYDGLDITSINDSLFELGYVPGSARLGDRSGAVLSDNIFTTGINIGDQNGCFEFVQEITFELEVKKPGYILQKTGRIKGEGPNDWRKVVNAQRGDVIEWRIYFENIGTTVLDDVSIVDDLPSYTTITPGSVELINGNNQGGFFYGPEAIQNGGERVNIIIDDYNPGTNAYIFMESTINDDPAIRCGTFQIANVAYAIPNYNDYRLDTINSSTKVNIINDEECEEPNVVATCDSLSASRMTANVGESITFTAKGTTTLDADNDDDDEITNYTFDVNGKGGIQDSNVYVLTPTSPGTYTVTATVNFTNYGSKTSANCVKTVTIVEEQVPVYSCDSLTIVKINDNTFRFTIAGTATNGAVITDYGYNFGDNSDIVISTSNTTQHTYASAGAYTASAAVLVIINGDTSDAVTSVNCTATVTVEEQENPVYVCDSLIVTLVKDNTYKFTINATAGNGATIKDYTYDFGDDTQVVLTDKNMTEHTYVKDGTFKAEATVRFNVDGEVKTVATENCTKTLTFSDEKCTVPGKEHLPKDSPDCREQVKGVTKKNVLPNTGAGSIAGAFAAVTAAGTAGHYLVTRRRK